MNNQKGASSVLLISTLAMVVGFATWSAISPLAAQLQKIFDLSSTEKSLLVAIPVLLGSIMRIPLGMLTDKYGGRRVYTALMLFLLIPSIGLGFADSYLEYIVWAFLLGMAGTTFAVGIGSVSKWFPPAKQGFVLGITGMGNFGTAIAGFLLPTIANHYGMEWAFWSLTIPIALSAAALFFFTKDPEKPKASQQTNQVKFSPWKYKMVWVLSLFYFVCFGGFVSFSVYLPSLLVDVFGITPVDAGMRAAGFVVIATLARPTGGLLADKFGAKKVLSLVFLLLGASALTLSFLLEHLYAMTIACLSAGLVVGIGNGAVFKLVPEFFPKNTGVVTGIVGAFGGIGGFFPPIVMGTVKDLTGDYVLGFVFLLVFTLTCFFLNRRLDANNQQTDPTPQDKNLNIKPKSKRVAS